MMTFCGIVHEEDVEKYVRTLILPSYMSYLCMEPFHFSDQKPNRTGREPLTLIYSGEGRLEEFQLFPEKHALSLLASLKSGISPEKVQLDETGSVWLWNQNGKNDSNADKESPPILKIFFRPKTTMLNRKSEIHFSARDSYVSVSRQELFLSDTVLQAYLVSQCRGILQDPEKEFEEAPVVTPVSGGVRFRWGELEGSFLLSQDEFLDDLIRFAGLEQSLQYVSSYVSFEKERDNVSMTGQGICIHLKGQE